MSGSNAAGRLRYSTAVQELDPDRGTWKIWDVLPGSRSGGEPDQEHLTVLSEALSEKGAAFWNSWRASHPSVRPDLQHVEFAIADTRQGPVGVNLSGYDLHEANLTGCELGFANLSGAKLAGAQLREALIGQSTMVGTDFASADLTQAAMSASKCVDTSFEGADLSRALLHASTLFNCNFNGADLEAASLASALCTGSTFRHAILRSARCSASDLTSCRMNDADLTNAHFVKTKFVDADLTGARVYGANCWDVEVSDHTAQRDLVITARNEPDVSVDDLRVAQFVHLILTNPNLRTVIDTVGQKAVLILGAFSDERKVTLDALRDCVRAKGLVPIVFDFDRPQTRDFSETVLTLAGMSYFVIADVTGPRSVPLELHLTVPNLMIPFVPVIQEGHEPFSMLQDLEAKHDWVLPTLEYDSVSNLARAFESEILSPAREMSLRIAARKAEPARRRQITTR